MDNIYRLLFNIAYNNKEFAIFLDKYNRYTFLEVINKSYAYPKLEDFIALHNIYNNISNIDSDIIKFNFKEKVLIGIASTLAISLIITANDIKQNYDIKVNEENVEISPSSLEPQTIYIANLSELTEYLGYSQIEFKKVIEVINANSNLTEEEKDASRTFALNTHLQYPTFDFRIFYENMKDLIINRPTLEEHQKIFGNNTNGNYQPDKNAISWPKDSDIRVLYHELGHVSEHIVLKKDNLTIKRVTSSSANQARYLGEAMNNILVSASKETGSYYNEGEILAYLLTCVNFTVEDFNQEDINGLVTRLKARYPAVDIDYITKYVDARAISNLHFGTPKYLKDMTELTDELFEICKSKVNINQENVYEPFGDFARLIYRNFSYQKVIVYLDRYNVYLQSLGFKNIISSEEFTKTFDKYREVKGYIILSSESKPIPYIEYAVEETKDAYYLYYKTIDEFGNIVTNSVPSSIGWQIDSLINPEYILVSLFKNHHILPSPKFWENLNYENKINSPHNYQEIPISYQNKNIANAKLSNVYLKIGLTPDNKIGFNVFTNNGFSLNTENLYTTMSNQIPILNFLPYFNWLENLNLDNYLTMEYLTEILRQKPNLFSNVLLKDNSIYFLPDYRIKVYDNKNVYSLKPTNIYDTYVDNGITKRMLVINDKMLDLGPGEYQESVDFMDVLEYFSLLKPDKLEYEFTTSEIVELFIRYQKEQNVKNAR